MLTTEQLHNVLFVRPVLIDFVYGHDWCHFSTSLENGVATISVWFLDRWVPMYHLGKDSLHPLADSPVYVTGDYVVSKYYQHMTNRFIKYWMGLISPLEPPIRTKVWSYCEKCGRKLIKYNSLINGCGTTCKKHKRSKVWNM